MDRARNTHIYTCAHCITLSVSTRNRESTLISPVAIQYRMGNASFPPFHMCVFPLLSDSEKSGSFVLSRFTYLFNPLVGNQLPHHVSHPLGSAPTQTCLRWLRGSPRPCWCCSAPSLPRLFYYKCNFKKKIIFIFFVGLENSKAICVVAGSDHSASLAGRYQLFQFNVPSQLCMFLL